MKILYLLVLGLGVFASGCTSTGRVAPDLVRMVAIGQGTARFIEHKETAPERSVRATEVIRIAGMLRAAAEGEDVSVEDLEARALDLVAKATNLSLADQALANTLVVSVGSTLRENIAAGTLRPKDRVRVALALDQIAAAARPYVQDSARLGPSTGLWRGVVA